MSPKTATSARVLTSSSLSRSPSRIAPSNRPRPTFFSTSPNASSSSGPAHVPGTGRPSGTLWPRVRLVEMPSAPDSMASSAISHIRAISSAFPELSIIERSPMAATRRAQ